MVPQAPCESGGFGGRYGRIASGLTSTGSLENRTVSRRPRSAFLASDAGQRWLQRKIAARARSPKRREKLRRMDIKMLRECGLQSIVAREINARINRIPTSSKEFWTSPLNLPADLLAAAGIVQ